MIKHSHEPDVAVGDRIDAVIHGTVTEVLRGGLLLVRYPAHDGGHAWIVVDPAAEGIGVSITHQGERRGR